MTLGRNRSARSLSVATVLRSAIISAAAIFILQTAKPPEIAAEMLTEQRAIAAALQRNPDLLAARQELESARARVVKAHYLNQFNPRVEAGASQAHFEFAPRGDDPQPQGAISLEVEVAGQRGKRIAEADQNLARVKAQIADAERLTRARALFAFYQAFYLQKRLQLNQEIESLNLRLRDASMVRFHSGEAPKLEANLAAIRYDQSRRTTLLARRDYENGIRALQRVIGIEPRGSVDLSGSLSFEPAEIDPEKVLQIAMADRPDLRARDYEIRRVAADIDLTRRLIVPNPIISGFVQRIADSPGNYIRVAGGTIGISVPLFDRKQAELATLHGQQRRASYERAAANLTIEQQVRDSIAAYDAAREILQLFHSDAVGRVKESFGLIEGSYRSGKTGLLELVVAENDLVATDFSYLDSLWDCQLARIDLETAAGASFANLVRQ
jgi:outer membrane protein, heavy metal efflux system